MGKKGVRVINIIGVEPNLFRKVFENKRKC